MAERNFCATLAFNFGIYFFAYLLLARILYFNRFKGGIQLADPVMSILPTVDFSAVIFFIAYTAILIFIGHILTYPKLILPAARAFLAVFALRVCFILLVPLQPPAGMIALNDPFIDNVVGFNNEVHNDLFFSGHISDLVFFALCSRLKSIKILMVMAAVPVAVMLVAQRVHYTADIIAAPFFVYACYAFFVKKYSRKFSIKV